VSPGGQGCQVGEPGDARAGGEATGDGEAVLVLGSGPVQDQDAPAAQGPGEDRLHLIRRRRQFGERRPGEEQRRAQVVHHHVDHTLLESGRDHLAGADAVLHRDGQATPPGRLGIELDQDLVLREVVRGEPDGPARHGRSRRPPAAGDHQREQKHPEKTGRPTSHDVPSPGGR